MRPWSHRGPARSLDQACSSPRWDIPSLRSSSDVLSLAGIDITGRHCGQHVFSGNVVAVGIKSVQLGQADELILVSRLDETSAHRAAHFKAGVHGRTLFRFVAEQTLAFRRDASFGTEAEEHTPHAVGYLGDVLVYEEMTSGQDLDLEGSGCVFSPSTCLLERHARIAIARYCHDRHVQRRLCCRRTIRLDGPIIATDHGKDHASHLVVFEKSRVRATQRSEVGDDAVVIGRMRILITMTRRGAAPGREQCERRASIISLEATRHLERHHRTHAVTEECEWLRFPRDQRLTNLIGELTNVLDQRLVTTVLSPWILDSEHQDVRFERFCQRVKIPCRTARERKAYEMYSTAPSRASQRPDPGSATRG
ncbi:protein of unknown function [Streptantibioticus cattleyicolor NRRL 8057 = DSM 46488]|nr:protein of unknown function [Streptantibioticus cattleyicolor NRRL 8057 = DSM 46488]